MQMVYQGEWLQVAANGARHACLVLGPKDGPLALLLHGFPDTPGTWRLIAPRLATLGYRVVAPALRGFAPTWTPVDGPAGPGVLGADANALRAALGGDERAILVGHDWGAAAAYAAMAAEPAGWRRVIAASWPPYPGAVDLASYEQMRRSWYVFLMLVPNAAEALRARDFEIVDRLWADWAPGHDRAQDVASAKDALRKEGNLETVVRHYRTLFAGEAIPLPRAPILYLHGEQDGCIGSELVKGLQERLVPGSRVRIITNAGHFPHLEAPDAVFSAISAWIA